MYIINPKSLSKMCDDRHFLAVFCGPKSKDKKKRCMRKRFVVLKCQTSCQTAKKKKLFLSLYIVSTTIFCYLLS